MSTVKQKLLTIVTEQPLEPLLTDELLQLGARGLSVVEARGRGRHGVRPSTWGSGNIQLELIGDEALIQRALAMLDRYRTDTALTAWVVDVEAWPSEKFVG
ncbi:MAG: transcriptional regulator [Myxococcota bacterium]